jgi:hypothetical protein
MINSSIGVGMIAVRALYLIEQLITKGISINYFLQEDLKWQV